MKICFSHWFIVGFFCVVSLLSASQIATAHGGHDERIKLKLVDGELLFDTHIPARQLLAFDANQDKEISAWEFRQSAAEIKKWIADNILVRSGSGERLSPFYFDIPVSEGDMSHDEGQVNFVRILQRYKRPESGGMTLGVTLYEGQSKPVLFYKDGKILRKIFPAGAIKMVLE